MNYVLRFGLVGLVGLIADAGIFNVTRLTVPEDIDFLGSPAGAKITSTACAVFVTWIGNRFWTFRRTRRSEFVFELLEFSFIAVIGMLISLSCLWISRYLLGFDSLFADNIAANVFGLGIATIFRFIMYRHWVFAARRQSGSPAPAKVASSVVLNSNNVQFREEITDSAISPEEIISGETPRP